MEIDSYTKEHIKKRDNHLYIAPNEELKNCIAHYTITFQNKEKKIPEGSVLHIIPDLSGCIVMYLDERKIVRMWGPMTEVVTLENDLNRAMDRFFIEFLPGGIYALLPVSMHQYVDEKIDLESILPELYQEFIDAIQVATTYDTLVEKMNDLCIKQLRKNKKETVYQEFIQTVQEDDFTLDSLCHQFHVSKRQIHRYFRKYIGITYATYKKIMNINKLLPTIIDTSLTDIAHKHEYFDQAHFNHAFKQICNTSPKKYIHNLSDFYNEVYKF